MRGGGVFGVSKNIFLAHLHNDNFICRVGENLHVRGAYSLFSLPPDKTLALVV